MCLANNVGSSKQCSLEEQICQTANKHVGLILGGIACELIDTRVCRVELEGPL